MNKHYIALQATYTHVEYALYKDNQCVIRRELVKTSVCTDLMFQLCHTLEENNLTWKNIAALIVNQGPAPFTTLRALIATVNGIAFAQQIPLVPIDGLAAFAHQVQKQSNNFLIILNAFAGDYYYFLKTNNQDESGCTRQERISEFIEKYGSDKNPITLTGNGIPLLEKQIAFSNNSYVAIDRTQEYVSLETVALCGFEKLTRNEPTVCSITPLYLKTLTYQASCNV